MGQSVKATVVRKNERRSTILLIDKLIENSHGLILKEIADVYQWIRINSPVVSGLYRAHHIMTEGKPSNLSLDTAFSEENPKRTVRLSNKVGGKSLGYHPGSVRYNKKGNIIKVTGQTVDPRRVKEAKFISTQYIQRIQEASSVLTSISEDRKKYTVYIVNRVPYAIFVENGWKNKKGYRIYKKARNRFIRRVRKNLEAQLLSKKSDRALFGES